jgi:SAM-dependent methyltransferase
MEPEVRALINAAARPYIRGGPYPYFFARSKLGIDPIFTAMLRTGSIPDGARVLDLGCGQSLLASLLLAARRQYQAGKWPKTWPEPPRPAQLLGIERDATSAKWARKALGASIVVQTADLRHAELPDADVVALFDVLHYLNQDEQLVLLDKIAHSLRGGGKMLLRVADSEAGWRFRLTRIVDHSTILMGGRISAQFFCRTIGDWTALLGRFGFRIEREPMSQGTPFANILLTAFRQP